MQYKYQHILVRYGELTTKGRNRRQFINRLQNNIKFALKKFDQLTYQALHDRFYIVLNGEDEKEIIVILKKIFGIASFSLAIKVKSEPQMIEDAAYQIVVDDDKNKTFKVLARRRYKAFEMNSDEINRMVASRILENTDLKVDVHNYDLGIIIEVGENETYVMGKVYQGLGGYPVGITGKGLLLLSGGIDSPVAGNLMQKRGLYLEAIHFASPPYTSDQALDKVMRLGQKLVVNQNQIRVFVVPFTKLQLAIQKNVPEGYEIIIMRRMMFRIAEKIAKKRKIQALISGESLGQVSSQTMESISVISDVVKMPVFRPLISMDKIEIIKHSRKIDTYDISIEPYDDACTIFNPQNPATKPKLNLAINYENYFDYQKLVDECVDKVELKVLRYFNEEKENDIF